jgi:hypothetical protein
MKKAFWLSGIVLMALFAFLARAAEPDDQTRLQLKPDMALLSAEDPEPNPPYEYWLGIQFRPTFPALRAQLHLPEGQGIVVDAVVPDSPAAKAGIAQYDVILKADDKKISDISNLQQAVEAAKDKEMKLEIIRDGQPKTIAVTPAKRPEELRIPAPPPESDLEAFRKWIEHMQPGAGFGQNGPMQFRFFRPGVILPHGSPIHPPLPGNMTITISKTGDKPADIAVKMGDEKWEVTEKDLDKLPENIRPYVDRMLGMATGAGTGNVRWMPEVFVPQPTPPQGPYPPGYAPGQPGPDGPGPGVPDRNPNFQPGPGPNFGPPSSNIEKRMEKRLEEMRQRMEKIENELHERHQGANTPDQPQATEKNKEETPGKTAL